MSSVISSNQAAPGHSSRSNYLYGPIVDFLLLGGGSILALAIVAFFWPQERDTATVSAVMLYLANVINHPHFAHSYQLFYRDFLARAFGRAFPSALRARYIFAAIIAPVALAAFFSYCLYSKNADLLGVGANLMFFLVGWHYVKQGYGMLMLDSVLKRSFFSNQEKNLLLWNAYAVWMTSWVQANNFFRSKNYWGIEYYTLPFPDELLYLLYGILAITTASVFPAFLKRWVARSDCKFPVNGAVAYYVSLYVWLLAWNPAMLIVIPAFHSLQYLAVVWKCRMRMEFSDIASNPKILFASHGPAFRLSLFIIFGFILGYLGFYLAPDWLGRNIEYDKNIFGGTLFLFIFWIFINVHHYFLDSVMWRKDNPDTKKYLFGS